MADKFRLNPFRPNGTRFMQSRHSRKVGRFQLVAEHFNHHSEWGPWTHTGSGWKNYGVNLGYITLYLHRTTGK